MNLATLLDSNNKYGFITFLNDCVKFKLANISEENSSFFHHIFIYKNCGINYFKLAENDVNITISFTTHPNIPINIGYPLENKLPDYKLPQLQHGQWITCWKNGEWIYFKENNIFEDIISKDILTYYNRRLIDLKQIKNQNSNFDIDKENMYLNWLYNHK